MTDPLLSPQDAAEFTGLSYHAILRAIHDGELRASKLRGRFVLRAEWVEEWIDANVITPIPPSPQRPVARRRRGSPADHAPGSVARLRAIEEGAR